MPNWFQPVEPWRPKIGEDFGDYLEQQLIPQIREASQYSYPAEVARREATLKQGFENIRATPPEMGVADYATLPLTAPINLLRHLISPVKNALTGAGDLQPWEDNPGRTLSSLTGVAGLGPAGGVAAQTPDAGQVLQDLFTNQKERQAARYRDLLTRYQMRGQQDTAELGRRAAYSENLARLAATAASGAGTYGQTARTAYEPATANAQIGSAVGNYIQSLAAAGASNAAAGLSGARLGQIPLENDKLRAETGLLTAQAGSIPGNDFAKRVDTLTTALRALAAINASGGRTTDQRQADMAEVQRIASALANKTIGPTMDLSLTQRRLEELASGSGTLYQASPYVKGPALWPNILGGGDTPGSLTPIGPAPVTVPAGSPAIRTLMDTTARQMTDLLAAMPKGTGGYPSNAPSSLPAEHAEAGIGRKPDPSTFAPDAGRAFSLAYQRAGGTPEDALAEWRRVHPK